MRTLITSNLKVWEIKDDPNNPKVSFVRASESRPIKDTDYDKGLAEKGIAKNGFVSTNWFEIKFVGKANNQLKKYIQVGDSISKLEASFDKEPYWNNKEGKIVYPSIPKITVYQFELPGGSDEEGQPAQTPRNIDRAPRIAEEEKYSDNQVPEYNEAQEENPF